MTLITISIILRVFFLKNGKKADPFSLFIIPVTAPVWGIYMTTDYSLLENKLLFVPFNDDYYVDDDIKKLLTEEEFFTQCFLRPDFDEDIEELLSNSSEEVKAFEVDLSVEDLVSKYEAHKKEKEALYNWIQTNENEIYCIRGDAGTGKSTFLHYLKFDYKNTDINWEIVDIQRAVYNINFLGYSIKFKEFQNLYYKTISSILLCLKSRFFVFGENNSIKSIDTVNNFLLLVNNYRTIFENIFPNILVSDFFDNISKILNKNIDERNKCTKIAEYISIYFNSILNEITDYEELLLITIELYLCVLVSFDNTKRHIIAFDNFERFIGTDEIYSHQLTEFVSNLRNIQNSISENLPSLSIKYQIIIFMRNTSTRMFTPQQVAEFTPHSFDLSEWFQFSRILHKKMDWYNSNNIDIKGSERIEEILNDVGYCKGSFRGLRSKLNMLFNNDKRIIIRLLIKVISRNLNERYLEIYDDFKNNCYKIDASLSRFAARMIIYRLLLNELRCDGFFQNIAVQKSDSEVYSLGHARKILTILYDYKLQHNDDAYMSFEQIICTLFGKSQFNIERYFDPNNKDNRNIISQILFFMNYYNAREQNWLQFIDIQYNINNGNKKISNPNELDEIINNHYKNVNIRITNAGVAYLYFVVYSFEYFSCKSLYSSSKNKIFGNADLPPLMAVIPTYSEIMRKKTADLVCIKVITAVSKEAFLCLDKMKQEDIDIPFKYKGKSYIYHSKRIINSHAGFLGNYIHCIREIYKDKYTRNTQFAHKLDMIIKAIERVINKYYKYAK